MYRLNHVYRDSDRPCLIGNRTRNRLSYPPCGVGGEFVALAVVKLVHRLHQPEVALLNQVKEEHPLSDIPLRDADDKTQVSLDKLVLCFLVTVVHSLGKQKLPVRVKQRHRADLLEVHPDRVVDRQPFLCQHTLHVLGALVSLDIVLDLLEFRRVKIARYLDTHSLKRIIELFYLLYIVINVLDSLHYLTVGKRPLRLSPLNEIVHLEFFLSVHLNTRAASRGAFL